MAAHKKMATMEIDCGPANKLITSKTVAQKVAAELKKIQLHNGGNLRPEDVVKAASPTSSPLHKYFEWDDSTAAEKYRLNQARHLIREVKVTILYSNNPSINARAFVSIVKDTGRSYESIGDVLSDKEYRQQMLIQALQDLNVWKKRYQDLKELTEVFKVVSVVMKKFKP